MKYINAIAEMPRNVFHHTFFSRAYGSELGYNVYLPPDYGDSDKRYPVAYHLHGWMGSESSEVWPMERVYGGGQVITVFPNSSPVIGDRDNLPVERMFINEFIPLIDAEYRTLADREHRSISGFSMGGGMAFNFAIRHLGLFSAVTAFAGTYHHYFHKGAQTVGAPNGSAPELYEAMIKERRYLEEGNILCAIRQNAEKLRRDMRISMHIGVEDVLFCDNAIVHMYLNSLGIPHKYRVFRGAKHELDKICLAEGV